MASGKKLMSPTELSHHMRMWLSFQNVDTVQVYSVLYQAVMDYRQLLIDAFPTDAWKHVVEKCFTSAQPMLGKTAQHGFDAWKGIEYRGRQNALYFVPVIPCSPEIGLDRIMNIALKLSSVRISTDNLTLANLSGGRTKDFGPNAGQLCLTPTFGTYTYLAYPAMGATLDENIAFLNAMFGQSDERFQSLNEALAAVMFGLPLERGQVLVCPKSVSAGKSGKFYAALEVMGVKPYVSLELKFVNAKETVSIQGTPYLLPAGYDTEYFLGMKRNNF